jgi:hypothetical protein
MDARTPGRDAMDATASGAQGMAGRDQLRERSTGARTNGAANCLDETCRIARGPARALARQAWTAKSCRPDAPNAGVKSCGDVSAQPGFGCVCHPQGDGGNRAWSHRGEREISRKPLRGESRMIRLPRGLLVRFVRTTAGAIGTRLSLRPLYSKRVK